MGYEESLRAVRIIGILDMVLSIFPIAFYAVVTFFFGFLLTMGAYNSGYSFIDWILANTMTIEDVKMDFDNPGRTADLRMFRCAVWGIAILFNLLELTMAFMLLQALRRSKTEQPFMGWLAFKAVIIFVMFIFLTTLLSTGSAFAPLLISIFYLIYRGVGVWIVYKHVQNIRDLGGVP